MALKTGKTLQARVDKDVAARFALIARARGVTESELVRAAIDDLMNDDANNIDALRAALLKEFEENERMLLAVKNSQSTSAGPESKTPEPEPAPASHTASRPTKARTRR